MNKQTDRQTRLSLELLLQLKTLRVEFFEELFDKKISLKKSLIHLSNQSPFSSINFLINQLSHQSTFLPINFLINQLYSSLAKLITIFKSFCVVLHFHNCSVMKATLELEMSVRQSVCQYVTKTPQPLRIVFFTSSTLYP